jgi:hypothetical protein
MFDSLINKSDDAIQHATTQAKHLMGEVLEHETNCWSRTLHGKSNLQDKIEVGSEILIGAIGLAAAYRLGIKPILSRTEEIFPKATQIPEVTKLDFDIEPWLAKSNEMPRTGAPNGRGLQNVIMGDRTHLSFQKLKEVVLGPDSRAKD